MQKEQKGFSLIELLFAGAVFTLFSTGVLEVFFFGLDTDRLGEETVIATMYARQGEEAMFSISAKNFDDLIVTPAIGIKSDNGILTLAGSGDVSEKYTRTIAIEEVRRDGSGNINEADGTVDTDTKKIIITVAWNVTPSRTNSVVLETYFTRYR